MFFLWIFLSIVLEMFPISSSGHMLLMERMMSSVQNSFISFKYIDHLMQGPIIFIIIIFFFKRWFFLIKNILRVYPILYKIFYLGFITELITALFYAGFSYMDYMYIPMSLGFLITAFALGSLYFCTYSKTDVWNMRSSILIGAVQGLALLPGVSRFGITFVTIRWLGGSNKKAFELSFLLELPVCIAGFAKGLWHLKHEGSNVVLPISFASFFLIILFSSCAALGCFKLIQNIVLHNKLWLFSWYVLSVACICLILGY